MRGRLEELHLADLLQAQAVSDGPGCAAIELSRHDGAVEGTIWIRAGRVLGAQRGEESGMAAFRALLHGAGAELFEVSRLDEPPRMEALDALGPVGALLLAVAGAVIAAGTTDLGRIARLGLASGVGWLTPSLLLCAAAFGIAAVAETGHEPFDNPDTHLELTMVHEGMLLEASGPRLAMLTYAAEVRLVVVAALFAAVFLPFGMASELTPVAVLVALAAAVVKLVAAAVVLALLDAGLAKLRILALPGLLGFASTIALIGLAARLWLPA